MRTRSAARSAAARAAAEGQPATEVVPPQASTSSPASPEAPSAPQGSPEYVRNVAGRSSQHAPRRVRASRNMKAEGALSSSGEAYYQFHAIPEYLRDNEYIKGYYRHSMPVRDSIKSLFGLHNETGNIYTHLLGFILFVWFTIYLAREPPTPLAMGRQQVELLWDNVHGSMQQLQGSFQHLQEGLSERVHSMQEGLSDTMHHFQDGISETVHHLQEGLSEGVHWLQDGLAHQRQQLSVGRSAVHRVLEEALSGVLSWPTARWPTYVYMGGAMTCLLLSSACHLLGCCQRHISQFVWRLDYAGIATLIVTSFYPPVYYGFMCHRFYLAFYLITTTAMGVMAVLVSLLDRFQAREWRYFRASMFSALGAYGIAPVVHQWWLNSDVPQVKTALVYDLIMGATYLSGGAIYALRVPERWFPGKFDLFFHSHQLFHIAVVVGACIHYYSVRLMLEWRDASGGCAAPVTSGHVGSVLQQMRELGHDLFSIDEVWGHLRHHVVQHVALGVGTQ